MACNFAGSRVSEGETGMLWLPTQRAHQVCSLRIHSIFRMASVGLDDVLLRMQSYGNMGYFYLLPYEFL